MKSILENRPALAKEVNKVAEVAGYLWQKGWAERNGGNITINITEFVDDEIRRMEPISEVKSIGVTLPYLKGCYFIGDSRTVALAAYDLIADENTIAEVGLSHIDALQHVYTQKSGLQYDVASFLEAKQPDILYIAFGVNGIAFVEESRYKEEYENMMDQILLMAPNSKVVIEAIGPIKEGYSMTSRMTNADIDHYNEFLYDLAEKKGIYYVDSNKCLKDDYNSLKDEYNSGDGLHYTQDGYAQVAEYIRSHPVTE